MLCFNKEDIAADPQVKELESIYESCGYPLVFVSAKEERGIENIRELLKGKTHELLHRNFEAAKK